MRTRRGGEGGTLNTREWLAATVRQIFVTLLLSRRIRISIIRSVSGSSFCLMPIRSPGSLQKIWIAHNEEKVPLKGEYYEVLWNPLFFLLRIRIQVVDLLIRI